MVPRTIVTCVALVVGGRALAHASPRSDPTAGRAVFTGATMPGESSITLNPAAIGPGRTDEITFGLAGVLEQLGIDRRVFDDATGELVDGARISDVEAGASAQLGGVWHPSSSITLGVDFRLPPPELFPNDPNVQYFTRGTRQRDYIVSGGASLKISSQFYFGFGLSHDVTTLKLKYARDTALDPGRGECMLPDGTSVSCGNENPDAAELYDVKVHSKWVSTENFKLNIGVLARVYKDLWIGVAYHNTPGFGIQSTLDGTMTVHKAPRDGATELVGDSTVYVSFPASVDGEVRARILPELDVHVGGRWEDLSRMQSYDVRGYGVAFRGQNIPEWVLRPRGFHDAVGLWAGVEQVDVGERVRLGGRLGFETSALTADRTAPGTVAPTSITLDGGVHLRIAPNWILRTTYGLQYFPKVSVDRSEYDPRFAIDCENGGFDYSTRACEQLRNGYATPTATGDYTRLAHTLRIALSFER